VAFCYFSGIARHLNVCGVVAQVSMNKILHALSTLSNIALNYRILTLPVCLINGYHHAKFTLFLKAAAKPLS